MICDILNTPINVFTPVEESVIVTLVCRACPIMFLDFRLRVDLVIYAGYD